MQIQTRAHADDNHRRLNVFLELDALIAICLYETIKSDVNILLNASKFHAFGAT